MKWAFSSLFWFLALTGAMAQTGIDGTILGVVADANGGLLSGATVTVTNLDTGIKKSEITRSGGTFEITALPAGRYSIFVTVPGFKTWTCGGNHLTIAQRRGLLPVMQ